MSKRAKLTLAPETTHRRKSVPELGDELDLDGDANHHRGERTRRSDRLPRTLPAAAIVAAVAVVAVGAVCLYLFRGRLIQRK